MSILIQSLILLPIISLSVFVYYRTLVWIGETIRVKWFRTTMMLILYIAFCVWYMLGIILSLEVFYSSFGFWIPFLITNIVFFVSAIFPYKRYKLRLNAVGIFFD